MSFKRSRFPMAVVGGALIGAALMLAGSATDVSAAGRFGAALMYREDADFGAQVRWTSAMNGKLNLVPQIGYLFDPEYFAFDLDLQYPFQPGDPSFYALGGLDLLTDFDDSEFGLNLGAGLNKNLSSSLDGFVEVKYVISDFDGLGFNFGLHF